MNQVLENRLKYAFKCSPEEIREIMSSPYGFFDKCLFIANATEYEELVELGFTDKRRPSAREGLMGIIEKERERLRKMAWFSKVEGVFTRHSIRFRDIDFDNEEDIKVDVSAIEMEIAATSNPWILVHSLYGVTPDEVLMSLMKEIESNFQISNVVGREYAIVYMMLRELSQNGNETLCGNAVDNAFEKHNLEPSIDFLDFDPSSGKIKTMALYDETFTTKDYFNESLRAAVQRCPETVFYTRKTFRRLLNQITTEIDEVTDETVFRLTQAVCAEEAITGMLVRAQ